MNGNVFIDTNIWVYAKFRFQEESKHMQAKELLSGTTGNIFVSTQVINEFYSVMMKNNIADDFVQKTINQLLPEVELQLISLNTIKKAWQIKLRYQYSIYDSLIIASAIEAGCTILYSEDMQHNQLIEEKLRIIDPFFEY
jgi:predicted nucleic acid-binding protein